MAVDLATRRGSVVAQLRAAGADPELMLELDQVLDEYSARMHKAEDREAMSTVLGRLAQLLEQLEPLARIGAESRERTSKALALLAGQPKLLIGVSLAVVASIALAFGASLSDVGDITTQIIHAIRGGSPCLPEQ